MPTAVDLNNYMEQANQTSPETVFQNQERPLPLKGMIFSWSIQ